VRFIVEAAYMSSRSLDEFIMLIGSCRVDNDLYCALVSTSATSATVEMQRKFAF